MTGTPSRFPEPTHEPDPAAESLSDLLGGRRAAIDATVGPLAFLLGWALSGRQVLGGVVAALAVSGMLAGWRLHRGDRPRAVLLGLLGVVAAALVALRTGQAEDFYLLRIVTNVASAMAWIVSIVLRWPLLGVVVGTALGQKGGWRHDPALLRAYGRGSWVWAGMYVLRALIWLPLWSAGQVTALGVTGTLLAWPLLAVVFAASWWVIRRSLPAGHPGLRHPVRADRQTASTPN